MSDILAGVGEYFRERGCYVLHFLEDPFPHIKVKRHGVKGFVQCEIVNSELRLLYRREDVKVQQAFNSKGGKVPIFAARNPLPMGSKAKDYELSDPDSLSRAFNYIKKHLFPPKLELRGGIGNRVHRKRL